MRAILLAAGEGRRLRPYTEQLPKCLVPLAGKSLLAYQLERLRSQGVEDIHVVTGYLPQAIAALGVPTVKNPEYDRTNMVFSLMAARSLLTETDDVLIGYGDIVYEPAVLTQLLASHAPISVAVNLSWKKLWEARMSDPLSDAETLKIDQRGFLTEIGQKAKSYEEIQGQYMGLILIRAPYGVRWVESYDALTVSEQRSFFMTDFLQRFIDTGVSVKAVEVDGGWLEVDTVEDLQLYEQLFKANRLKQYCDLNVT